MGAVKQMRRQSQNVQVSAHTQTHTRTHHTRTRARASTPRPQPTPTPTPTPHTMHTPMAQATRRTNACAIQRRIKHKRKSPLVRQFHAPIEGRSDANPGAPPTALEGAS